MGVQGLWALEGEATLSPCDLGGWLAGPVTGPLGTAHFTARPIHEVDEGAGWAGPAWLKGAGKAVVDQLRSLGQPQQLREPVP